MFHYYEDNGIRVPVESPIILIKDFRPSPQFIQEHGGIGL
jgi:hypothetical protein